ncbi:MAG: SusC/RagA family TonB-linked outer membrane protein [Carboxylicivirga sp.]|jgi:TonB-linked SusC/RagA family outer membrane protein|nr:SusC/RagA family TonB-linked outer membrane protein [Carboxylicivirga sp.]
MKKRWKDLARRSSRLSARALFCFSLFGLVNQVALAETEMVTSNVDVAQQNQKIRGKVTDDAGDPLPGVNIVIKGTTTGVITNFDGEYSMEAPIGSTIVYSFIGFKTEERIVSTAEVIHVVLTDDSMGIDEVVVTAMGVVAEKKNLNFAVQSVDAQKITNDKQNNFVNSLQGRVAGVEVSAAGGSPNAASQILIRGASSIDPSMNNEPIFILNGMHVAGGAAKAAEINPEDIENVTILKGAAAAALYGSEAANGAIMITTKSGKAGAMQVTLSSTLQLESVANLPELQDSYLRGGLGVYREESKGGWGPLKPVGTKTYDNVDNFLQTGVMQKYDLSMSGGSEKFNTYASVSYLDHEGVMPNDYLKRLTFLVKSEYNIRENLSVDVMANITNKESRGGSSMGSVYSWPIDDDMSHYKTPEGDIRWLYVNSNNKYNSPLNPNWSRHEDESEGNSYRTLVQGAVKWEPIEDLNLTGRVSYDLTNSDSEYVQTPRWADPEGETAAEDLPYLGYMSLYEGKSEVINFGALARYTKNITSDIKIEALTGIDFKRSIGNSQTSRGYDFIVPGLYSFNNLSVKNPNDIFVGYSQKELVGIFGELKFDYKGIAHVGATLRNDNSSTLADDKDSYHYPSFSGGLILTELLNVDSPLISFGKIRGNWARVGKDTNAYKQHNYMKNWIQHPDGGYGVDPVSSGNRYLDPEFTDSWEIGVDMRLFNDKTRIDVAYYSTFVDGQIVTVRVPVTTGNVLQTRNEGDISNKGIEVTLNQKIISSADLKWDLTANFAHNEGTVGDLPGDVKEIYHYAGQIGTMRPASIENGPVFGLTGKDYQRAEDGQVIVREDGTPVVSGSSTTVLGNREADFTIGIENSWKYKNLGLSVLVDIRKGGDVYNGTLQNLMSNGMAANLEDYRNREIIVEGVVEQADGTYVPNTTPVIFDQLFYSNYFAPAQSNFVEDGSFVRLSTVALSYNLSSLSKQIGIEGLKVSVTGRNLFLWSNYSGSDPVINHTGNSRGAGTYGVDYLRIPSTRSVSFNITANF